MEELDKAAKELEIKAKNIQKDFASREEELKKKEDAFKKEEEEMSKKHPIKGDIVDLNVGGTRFTTYRSTLTKVEGSMLKAMFSGRHQLVEDSEGRYFIDRAGESFVYVLHYLRTGEMVMPASPDVKELFESDLEYFGLRPLFKSNILNESQKNQLNKWIGNAKEWTLLLRGTEEGFNYQKCHGKSPTVVVVRSQKGNIFGGYSTIPWRSGRTVSSGWIFSLVNPQGVPHRFDCVQPYTHSSRDKREERKHYSRSETTISFGEDLTIASNQGSSYLGEYFSNQFGDSKFLDGQSNFMITEIEIFEVK